MFNISLLLHNTMTNLMTHFYRFGRTNSGFDLLLESVIGQFYKKEDIDEVNKFFNNKDDLGSVERGVKKGNFWQTYKTPLIFYTSLC